MKKLISIFAILALLMITSVSADTVNCNRNCVNGVAVEAQGSDCAASCVEITAVCANPSVNSIYNGEAGCMAELGWPCEPLGDCACDDCCDGCDEIPEFGAIGAGIALLGVGAYMLKKRK